MDYFQPIPKYKGSFLSAISALPFVFTLTKLLLSIRNYIETLDNISKRKCQGKIRKRN